MQRRNILRPKRPEVIKFEKEKEEFDVETAFKETPKKGETIPEDKELEIKQLDIKDDAPEPPKVETEVVEVEEECVPIETEIVMPKPKTREWLCECGTKLKTGSAKNIKAHTSTQTHRNRMALIGQGLKPEDHMDKVYPNRFKTKTQSKDSISSSQEPSETQVQKPPPKPINPVIRQKQIQQVFQPIQTQSPYDFEDRVQSEVNKRWEAKVKQEERERRLIKEAEERVRKEYEEKLKPPPAVRGQTFRPRKSNRTFDTTSTMLGRRRQYNF